MGEVIYYKRDEEDLYTFTISGSEPTKTRRALPFLQDEDKFHIE
jgi:hypothetical protein